MMNDKGVIAPYLASSLVNVFNSENESQLSLMKHHISTEIFLIHGKIVVTLYSSMLIFRDNNKSFKLYFEILRKLGQI